MASRASALIGALFALAVIGALSAPVTAKPLDRDACATLKQEHKALVDPNMAADLEKGANWAKENLGQLRLQKIERLFVVEEQLAFRCRGFAVADALVIPSLRTAVTAPPLSVARGQGSGLRISTVPPPVRRPARAESARAVPVKATAVKQNTVTDGTPSPTPTGAKNTSELPKVIRLQKGQNAAGSNAVAKKKRRAVKRVRKPRLKPTKRPDAYVPPPANPGYQPSLAAP